MKIPLPNFLKRKSFPTSIPGLSRHILLAPGIVALAITLMGCGSIKPIKYYQVNYPTKSFVAQDAINTGLLVRPFETSHLYLDDKIVYGYDSPEMGTYEYQRWAEPPVEIVQNSLVRGLRASGRFRAVYMLHTDADSRFVLGGHLYDFKEIDGTSTVARLTFAARLRDRKTGTTVWEHTYTHDESASEKSVTAFVLAMDKNLQQGVQEVQAGLDEYFRAHPPQ
jgi:ABC-type uncharacterized transport system auxiliary subunit